MSQIDVIIVEIHEAKTPWGVERVASVQFIDREDGWVSHVVPIPFKTLEELKERIKTDIAIYLARKNTLGKAVARKALA